MRLSFGSISICILALTAGCSSSDNGNTSSTTGSTTGATGTAASTTSGGGASDGGSTGSTGASTTTSGSTGGSDGGGSDAGATATGGTGGTTGTTGDAGATGDASAATSGDATAGTTGDAGRDGSVAEGGTSDGGATDGGTGSLPPPDLSNVCGASGDSYEENDTFAAAKPLTLDGAGRARIGAGVVQSDDDFYTFVAPKSDPVSFSVIYSVSGGNTSNLTAGAYDTSDTFITEDDTARTGSSQTLQAEFEATANGTYAIKVHSDGETCTAYELDIDALVCTDSYEDNDTRQTASTIMLDSMKKASLSATIDGRDDDYYQFAAPKHDPIKVTGSYTRPTGDTADLSLAIYDQTGTFVTEDSASRTQGSETMQTVWEAGAAGETYYVKIRSDTNDVCAPYDVSIDGLTCTDSLEDNDDFASAKALSGSQTLTISGLDDDYFTLTGPAAAGSCTVTYTPATGSSSQQLGIALYSATQDFINEDRTDRTGNSQTLTVSWADGDNPHYVKVDASDDECTTYTIQCQ